MSKPKAVKAAEKIAKDFNRLSLEEKDAFASATISVILQAVGNPRLKKKIFKAMRNPKKKRGTQTTETITQLSTAFLWSIKPNYRYKWAQVLYKFLGGEHAELYAEHAQKRDEQLKQLNLRFVYLGLTDEGYKQINEFLSKLGSKPLDDLTIL